MIEILVFILFFFLFFTLVLSALEIAAQKQTKSENTCKVSGVATKWHDADKSNEKLVWCYDVHKVPSSDMTLCR